MKDKSGKLKKRCPDHKAEARAAYSRVKAVYGTVDEVAALKSIQDVTQHLGTVKRISAETASETWLGLKGLVGYRLAQGAVEPMWILEMKGVLSEQHFWVGDRSLGELGNGTGSEGLLR